MAGRGRDPGRSVTSRALAVLSTFDDGHPRLRLRHAPFTIGPRERDAWLHHMRAAVESLGLDPGHEATLWTYLERAAFFMVNTLSE